MLSISPVRKATASDEPELMEMCRELHQENGLFDLNEDKVCGFLRRAFATDGGAIIGVIGERGVIQAGCYLLISNFWYSDDWHLEEFFLYVRPQFRKSNNAKELMSFAKRCSNELGIPLVMGVLSSHQTEGKIKLYQRQFAKPRGSFFVYNSKDSCADVQAPNASSEIRSDHRKAYVA